MNELDDGIDFISEQFNSVVNYELLDINEWDEQEFKSSFTEENIWAGVNGDNLIVWSVEVISLAEKDENI